MKVDELLRNFDELPIDVIEHLERIRSDSLIMHRRFAEAFKKLHGLIVGGAPGQLILVSGPTNLGKTTLVRAMDLCFIASAQQKGNQLWGSAYIRLPSPVLARFDNGATYRRILTALDEPLIDKKVAYPGIRDGMLPRQAIHRGRGPTHEALWGALVKRLRNGHPAVFLDEAGDLAQALKFPTLREAINKFKELADVGGSCVVLIGGPEVAPISWDSGQIATRVETVEMNPYYPHIDEDRTTFCALLLIVENNLSDGCIVPGTLSTTNSVYLMEKVRGTFGIALKIVIKAVKASLIEKKRPLTWSDLKEAIDAKMKEIGPQVCLEQDFWEASKDQSTREAYWGIYSARRLGGGESKRPAMSEPTKQPASSGGSKEGHDKVTPDVPNVHVLTPEERAAQEHPRKKRGMRTTVPQRIPIGCFEAEPVDKK